MALLLGACAPQQAPSCATPLKPAVEVDLFFGRNIEGGGRVSDAEWADFLATEVTPRFPNGFTVVDANGQYREPSGEITREPSKLVVLVVFDTPDFRAKVTALIEVYRKRFRQHEVLRLERPVCAG